MIRLHADKEGSMSFMEDLGVQIRGYLQREQTRINEEIGQYPAPIAGCDQQS
jgi:hypothetical protein